MGSSAALITSIVSALLLRLKVTTGEEFSQPDSDARKLAHNTAQFVHCFAQGKVGSGFDVSAAAFGSQLYTRFSPALLDGLMKGGDVSPWTRMAMLIVMQHRVGHFRLLGRPHYPQHSALAITGIIRPSQFNSRRSSDSY